MSKNRILPLLLNDFVKFKAFLVLSRNFLFGYIYIKKSYSAPDLRYGMRILVVVTDIAICFLFKYQCSKYEKFTKCLYNNYKVKNWFSINNIDRLILRTYISIF